MVSPEPENAKRASSPSALESLLVGECRLLAPWEPVPTDTWLVLLQDDTNQQRSVITCASDVVADSVARAFALFGPEKSKCAIVEPGKWQGEATVVDFYSVTSEPEEEELWPGFNHEFPDVIGSELKLPPPDNTEDPEVIGD